MKDIDQFPRVPLAHLPTPIQFLPKLSARTGKSIYLKRDDMTGVSLGGNKVRKLEFLLADAMARGCDTILTTGGAQSNHAMLTAACCNKLGLHCILVLKERGVTEKKGNLLLDDLLGAQVRFVDADNYDEVHKEMDAICADLAARGHKGYQIPVGGSVPLGCLGYVQCVREIARQADGLGVRFDDMVCAAGSGGTLAGLILGGTLYAPHSRVTGVAVDDSDFASIAAGLVNKTAALLDAPVSITADKVDLHPCYGAGYALPSPEGVAAIRTLAQTEGLILDPVYTGKALAGLLELIEQGYFDGRENILFLHSGGAGGLFAIDVEHPVT